MSSLLLSFVRILVSLRQLQAEYVVIASVLFVFLPYFILDFPRLSTWTFSCLTLTPLVIPFSVMGLNIIYMLMISKCTLSSPLPWTPHLYVSLPTTHLYSSIIGILNLTYKTKLLLASPKKTNKTTTLYYPSSLHPYGNNALLVAQSLDDLGSFSLTTHILSLSKSLFTLLQNIGISTPSQSFYCDYPHSNHYNLYHHIRLWVYVHLRAFAFALIYIGFLSYLL